MAWGARDGTGVGAYIGSNPTARLHDPAETSARIANRDLQLAASAERAGQFDGFTSLIHDSPEDVLETSILIFVIAVAAASVQKERRSTSS